MKNKVPIVVQKSQTLKLMLFTQIKLLFSMLDFFRVLDQLQLQFFWSVLGVLPKKNMRQTEADVAVIEPTVIVVKISIPAPKERCFATASSTETLPRIWIGSGAVPGVVSARMEDDLPMAVGNTRLVSLTDGTTARETYIDFSPPNTYAYRMSDIQGSMGNFLTHAEGFWKFSSGATDAETEVEWTYRAYPFGTLTRFPAWLIVNLFLKSAMQSCLERVKELCEN